MDELAVIKSQNLQRLRVQLQFGAPVVKRLHPRKQFAIEKDGIAVRRQFGRFRGLHLVEGGIGVGLHHAKESVVDPLQHAARAFHRGNGVVESGRGLVAGNGGDLRQLLLHAFFKGRLVIAVLDQIKARRLIGQRARGIKWAGQSGRSAHQNQPGNKKKVAHIRPRE